MREPRVAVIEAGAWGTTVASVLADRATVTLWAREHEVVESVNDRHRNDLFVPEAPLAPALRATGELGTALRGADVVVAVPAQHFRAVLSDARACIASGWPWAWTWARTRSRHWSPGAWPR